ncbi:response regulator [Paenibacillus sp. J5C_2022]|uniref:response regulator transcription factor n=1 Tax=Paenibacillus sp. J5C2022 TaxID=2977129 RepID=UPI0021CF4CDE|nr:response regulator [Paenibacillus sp. J5C2022]MCU6710452.1 response regulator [Paenibacillus sp. J5C2022]
MRDKVLLVDDEAHITRNLEKVIPWEMLGLEVAATAKNGVDALALMEKESIQLLLCDIRMPVMDGLELVREVREREFPCDIIMLSGYQDFAYTRTAIQYGVKDYILKPIPYDELTGVIARVMAAQREKAKQQSKENKKLEKIMDLASEKLLYDLMMDYTEFSEGHWLFIHDESHLKMKQFSMILLDFDVSSEHTKDWREWSDKERKLWNFAVSNVLREKLQVEGLQHAVIGMRDGEWCVLIEPADGSEFDYAKVKECADTLLSAVKEHIKLSLNAGIYRGFVEVSNLAKAYRKLQLCMQLTPVHAPVTFYPDAVGQSDQTDQLFWGALGRIIDSVKRGDHESVERECDDLSKQLQCMNDQHISKVEPLLHFFLLHLMRELKEMAVFTKEQEESLWRKLDRRFSIKDLMELIRGVTTAVSDKSMDKKKQSENTMLEAKTYLDRNMFRDISLDETAMHVGLSTSYFSLLFKQTYGVTFIEYITRNRMEKAKELLANTQMSITSIAKEIGYAERRYFTKVFMKYTGDNPSDYRAKHQQGDGE